MANMSWMPAADRAYAEWLVAHGGIVVAIDANEKMVALARQRLGEKVQVLQADLEAPLDFLVDASFDMVVSPLVMDYIKDWEAYFRGVPSRLENREAAWYFRWSTHI